MLMIAASYQSRSLKSNDSLSDKMTKESERSVRRRLGKSDDVFHQIDP